MRIATGTAIQFRAVAIVSAPASTARTNSGPMPQRSTTTNTAPYPSPVSFRTRGVSVIPASHRIPRQ